MNETLPWVVLGAFSFLLAGVSWYFMVRYFLVLQEIRGIPGPKGWPYVGILPTFLENKGHFHLTLQEWEKQYGKMYTFVIMGQRWYVTSDASLISKVALARPASYTRRRKVTSVINEAGLMGVFSAEGEAWARQRKVTAPAFSSFKVADMQASMGLVLERLMRMWDDASGSGQIVDAIADLMKFSLDVISLTSFSFDINSLQGNSQMQEDIRFTFHVLGRRTFLPIPTWRYKWLANDEDRAYEECRKRMMNLILSAKRKAADNSATGQKGADNLLKRLLQSEAEEKGGGDAKLSDDEIVGNILTFFLGGQDTTAITMAWTLFFLATRSEIQAEVRAEADRVLGADRNAGSEAFAAVDTKDLKYLTMVIKESMRLKPVGPWVSFQPTKTTKVQEGLVLHPDNVIVILAASLAKSEEYFERPLEFEPKRWEGDTRGLGMTPGTSPFGWGQRICPGRFLALTEMQLCLAAICHRFIVTLAPDCPAESVKEIESFTMRPTAVRLSLLRRRA